MMFLRKHLYPPNWKQLATACKERAEWQCQRCHIQQGATRTSQRTGKPYRVWLHAAHVHFQDTLNPHPALRCLCPTCHGCYDYQQRRRAERLALERHKHQHALRQRGYLLCGACVRLIAHKKEPILCPIPSPNPSLLPAIASFS